MYAPFYVKRIIKMQDILKKTSVYIKDTNYVFLPQQTLKQ